MRKKIRRVLDPVGTPEVVEKPNGKTVWLSAKRWHVLEVMAKTERWLRVVELGVLNAPTSLHLLAACPFLYVVGVDAYRVPKGSYDEPGYTDYPGRDMEALFREVGEKFAAFGERARLLRMDTVEASALFPDRSLNAVFIDADHRRPNVVADIRAWLPKVVPGGWLMGHDWHMKSVREAVRECGIDPVVMPDNVWAVRC